MADFATFEDIESIWRPLNDSEQTAATERLAEASALLRILVPGIDDRAAADPNLAILAKAKVVNAVFRVMRNPMGAKQLQEAAGPFSHSMSGMDGSGSNGVFFTDDELMVLRASTAQIGSSYVGVRRGWGSETGYRRDSGPGDPYQGDAVGQPFGYGPGWWPR